MILQFFRLVSGGERINYGIEVSVYDIGYVEVSHIPRQSVVSDSILGEIIGTYSVTSVARANLILTFGGYGGIFLFLLRIIQL